MRRLRRAVRQRRPVLLALRLGDRPGGPPGAGGHDRGANAPPADEPGTDAPTADEPATDAATADEPPAGAPTADEPPAGAPTADEPPAGAPTTDDSGEPKRGDQPGDPGRNPFSGISNGRPDDEAPPELSSGDPLATRESRQ